MNLSILKPILWIIWSKEVMDNKIKDAKTQLAILKTYFYLNGLENKD